MAQDVQAPHPQPDQIQLLPWLRLSQVPGFGAQSLKAMFEHHGITLDTLFDAGPAEWKQWGFQDKQIHAMQKPNSAWIEAALNWLEQHPLHGCLTLDHPQYPALLGHISSPPLILFYQGELGVLDHPQFAVVGTRNPSHQAKRLAEQFSAELVHTGFGITSGLALGIDGCAHRGALTAGGITLAVLGSGIDQIYPRRHIKLAEQILASGGAVLSEFAPGTLVRPDNFPRRNRIISGLSHGTLIVEAAIKSGSLITAKYALEQNREVFAIPGNVANPLAKGCHLLIRQGAKLVESVTDITEEFQNLNFLRPANAQKNMQKSSGQSLASDNLLDSVGFEVTALDEVAQRSQQPVNVVLAQLLEYELRGKVASVPGGYIKLGGK